jgi:hypothetical protein
MLLLVMFTPQCVNVLSHMMFADLDGRRPGSTNVQLVINCKHRPINSFYFYDPGSIPPIGIELGFN